MSRAQHSARLAILRRALVAPLDIWVRSRQGSQRLALSAECDRAIRDALRRELERLERDAEDAA